MSQPTFATRANLDLIDENYLRWQRDPMSVDAGWRSFFEGFDLGIAGGGSFSGSSSWNFRSSG